MSDTSLAHGLQAPDMAMEQDPNQGSTETGQGIIINALDPSMPFGGDCPKPLIGSIYATKQEDGSYIGIDGETLEPQEIADTVARLLADAHFRGETIGNFKNATQDTDHLALTPHEEAVVAKWEAEKEEREIVPEDGADEDQAQTQSGLSIIGRIAAGTAGSSLLALGGGAVIDATPVNAQSTHNTTPIPLTAKPFFIESPSRVQGDQATSLSAQYDTEETYASTSSDTLVPGPDGLITAGSSSESSLSPDQMKECIRVGSILPKFIRLVLAYPGKKDPGGRQQTTVVQVNYRNSLPDYCDEDVLRTSVAMPQFRDTMTRNWRNGSPFARPVYSGNAAGGNTGPIDRAADITPKRYLLHCPGSARAVYTSKVVSKKEFTKVPIKGEPGLYRLKRKVLAIKETIRRLKVKGC